MADNLIVYLAGGALLGVLLGAVVAGVMRKRLVYWVAGGAVLGAVAGFVGFSDRSGVERDTQVFFNECVRGIDEMVPTGGTAGEDYCGCLARKLETDESGFRSALIDVAAQTQEDMDQSAAASLMMSNQVIAETTRECLEPVATSICVQGQAATRADADAYCRCAVDGLFELEGGMAILGEKLAVLADPEAFAADPDFQSVFQACD